MIRFFVGVILFCAALWAALLTVGMFASIGKGWADANKQRAASSTRR
jgi:hypothetical protein